MPTLRIKLPNQTEVTHEISAERITVGRRPDNTIQIIDRSVSAHHAELVAVDGHYRLHDLEATNLTFIDGVPVSDYHLHAACKIGFGMIECEYDPVGRVEEPKLTRAQMEADIHFLRGENFELLSKIDALQRRIDILSSARLVTGRTEVTPFAAANDSMRAVSTERDDLRHRNTGLKLELENMREERDAALRERDAACQQNELLLAEKVMLGRELQELRGKVTKISTDRLALPNVVQAPIQLAELPEPAALETGDVGTTQRITLPVGTVVPTPARKYSF